MICCTNLSGLGLLWFWGGRLDRLHLLLGQRQGSRDRVGPRRCKVHQRVDPIPDGGRNLINHVNKQHWVQDLATMLSYNTNAKMLCHDMLHCYATMLSYSTRLKHYATLQHHAKMLPYNAILQLYATIPWYEANQQWYYQCTTNNGYPKALC